jgi:acyl-[acyl-carrier-protein]-phospholipid O-acyltransferase/long-chain-fatty-acid--[acyl-carrier-protein] ligase
LGIALLFFLLFFFSHNLITCIILLLLIGIFGGMFIVPFDSFVQTFSPDEKRGQIIATTNFLSFTGVLISSFCLYLFSNIFGLSSAAGFFLMGIITTCFALIISARLSDYALPFFSRIFLHLFYRVRVEDKELLERNPSKVLILEKATAKKAILLAGEVPYLQLLIPDGNKKHFSFITKAFFSFHLVQDKDKLEDLIEDAKKYIDETSTPCLLLDREIRKEEITGSLKIVDFLKRKSFEVIVVKIEKLPWGTIISFRQA